MCLVAITMSSSRISEDSPEQGELFSSAPSVSSVVRFSRLRSFDETH